MTFPTGSSSTAYLPSLVAPVNFLQLPPPVRGMNTHVVYLRPDQSRLFNLAGPNKGSQGVRLATQLMGDQQWPFKQVITNSPYLYGASIQRQNVPERLFDMGIIIGSQAPPMTEYQFRMAEWHWWDGQDENNDGWLGIYTRYSGWRWIRCARTTVKSPQKTGRHRAREQRLDVGYRWLTAGRPYFTKPALYDTFRPSTPVIDCPPPGGGILSGSIDFVDAITGRSDLLLGHHADRQPRRPAVLRAASCVHGRPGHRAGQRQLSGWSRCRSPSPRGHLPVRHRTVRCGP